MLKFILVFITIYVASCLRRSHQLRIYMKFGNHGQEFRYMPMHQGKERENFPRIVQIAGVYPDILPDDILAPPASLPMRQGSWTYDFSDPSGPQLGTVALPPSDRMTNCIDPIAVISSNVAVGIKIAQEVEVVIVIDRGDRFFKPDLFYAFRTPENTLTIKWCDKLEPGYEILGSVVICTVPWVEGMKKAKSGFLEDDEDDDE